MTNVGTGPYPKWLCSPCAASRRGLLSQGQKDAHLKRTWAMMEKEYPRKCKEAITAGRVKPDGEDPDIPGVNCIGDGILARKGVIAVFEENTTASSRCYVQTSLMRLPKAAFIAQSKLNWGISDDEAESNWRVKMHAINISPDTPGSEKIEVPFNKPVENIGAVGRATEHVVKFPAKELRTPEDCRVAAEKMTGQFQANQLEDRYADLGGDSFKGILSGVPGSAAGGPVTVELLKLTAAEAAVPRTVIQVPEIDKEVIVNDKGDEDAVTVPRYSVYLCKPLLENNTGIDNHRYLYIYIYVVFLLELFVEILNCSFPFHK